MWLGPQGLLACKGGSVPDYYFHYTSRQAAQGIRSSGRMEAGANGVVYLTLDTYSEGTTATNALAIEAKPVEVVGMIPGYLVSPMLPATVVLPTYDAVTGKLKRRGGGSQLTVPGPLPATDVHWFGLSPP